MKHAFLIMAHGSLPLLRVLLSMLDDERNDIFLAYRPEVGYAGWC